MVDIIASVAPHVTVISSERETPLAHAQVVVRGEKIAWIGTEAPSGISALEPIEGTGMYLVPGLIDGHVHLGSIPGMSREQAAAMPELAEAYYRQLPRSYLYFGFTTIVDVNVMNCESMPPALATAKVCCTCGAGR